MSKTVCVAHHSWANLQEQTNLCIHTRMNGITRRSETSVPAEENKVVQNYEHYQEEQEENNNWKHPEQSLGLDHLINTHKQTSWSQFAWKLSHQSLWLSSDRPNGELIITHKFTALHLQCLLSPPLLLLSPLRPRALTIWGGNGDRSPTLISQREHRGFSSSQSSGCLQGHFP